MHEFQTSEHFPKALSFAHSGGFSITILPERDSPLDFPEGSRHIFADGFDCLEHRPGDAGQLYLELPMTSPRPETALPSACFVAIEIGGTKLQLLVGDAAGKTLDEVRLTVDRSWGGAGIRAQIEEALPRLLAQWQPSALGVGFGGPVDWQTGQVCCSHQIEGWADFPLGQWLGQLSRRPVVVDNDANLAALGEATHGAGAGCSPVFYITLGSGVGGTAGGRGVHKRSSSSRSAGNEVAGMSSEGRCCARPPPGPVSNSSHSAGDT